MDGSQSNSITTDNENFPLWSYVTKQDKIGVAGGNIVFQCNFCQLSFKGSYFRVKAHLLRTPGKGIRACSKVNSEQLQEMIRLVEQAETRIRASQPHQVPLPSKSVTREVGSKITERSFEQKKRKGSTSVIEKAFHIANRNELHEEIARMFYSAGLPFHLARNPYYVRSYSFAANTPLGGYLPPGYNMLRTTLLQRERANIERLILPIKESWKKKGVSIVSDGWTDSQRRPIINFIAVSESGPLFLKAINCEGAYKDKYFVAQLILDTINQVGHDNVVQVITDNAPVCKSAGLLIEAQFPDIFWTPCIVHTINLTLKKICSPRNCVANELNVELCQWISDIAGDAAGVKNYIMNHSMRLAMFNDHSNLKMLSVAETRFASTIVMLKRLRLIKRALQTMVISDRWASYREEDGGKASFVKEKMLDDLWWDKVDYFLAFTEPIYEMLRLTDTDMPSLHLVYDMWDSMIEKVKTIIYRHEGKNENEYSPFYYNIVHEVLVDRWEKSNTPLHCLAHSLNPRYYSTLWLGESSTRVPPHKDEEISREREKCFQRYFTNTEKRRKVNVEFARFSACYGEFASVDSMENRGYLEPSIWWVLHGSSTPTLQNLALKILGQPCSSSCSERNWSTYSFIHSLKRNKITPQRAEDLVFVHSNLRLLSRKDPNYKEGVSRMWDIGGDAFDSMEGAGILEVADLSLDEPELEAILFTDDGNEEDDDQIDLDE